MKWEYKTAAVGVHDENTMGDEGWEMVAVQGNVAFYKRPKEEAVAEVEMPVDYDEDSAPSKKK